MMRIQACVLLGQPVKIDPDPIEKRGVGDARRQMDLHICRSQRAVLEILDAQLDDARPAACPKGRQYTVSPPISEPGSGALVR